MVNDVKELIAIESVLGTAADNAPFGPGPRAALDWFLRKAGSYGLKTGELDGYCGWAEYGAGDRMIGMLCHLDVVPADPAGWTSAPYSAEVRDSRLYGRGAADDKGPAVACLHVLKRLKEENADLGVRVRVIVGCNEENGSACMKYYRTHGELPDVNLVPDADFPVINSEKTIYQTKYFLPAGAFMSDNAESLTAGSRPNVVPAYAELRVKPGSALEARLTALGGDNGLFSRSPVADMLVTDGHRFDDFSLRRDGGRYVLSAVGVAGHAMEPEKGDNAVAKLFSVLAALTDDETVQKLYDRLLSPLAPEKLGIAVADKQSGHLTLNVGTAGLAGGELVFSLDMRCPVSCDTGTLPSRIAAAMAGGRFETIHVSPYLYIDENSPLVKTLLEVYTSVTGEAGYTVQTGGGTYARELPRSIAFGATFPGTETNIHNADESYPVAHLDLLEKIYRTAAKALAEKLKKGEL